MTPVAAKASSIDVGHHADRVAEDLLALHAQMADRARGGRAAIDVELVAVPAVGAQMRGEHAAVAELAVAAPRFQHHRAGAVAEQHAGGAVGPVENAREGLGADDQRALVRARAQELVGRRQRVDEAGADRLQVEGRAVVMPSAACTCVAVAGKVLSGVEVATMMRSMSPASSPASSSAARAAGCARSEVVSPSAAMWRSRMPVRCDDPLVGGVDHLGEFGVGEHALRQVGAAAEDDGTQ